MDIVHHRNVSQTGAYAMIAQLRGWMPGPIGGIYWFVVDNYKHSPYIPVYAGVMEISSLYSTYEPRKFDENSARWVYDFVDTMLQLQYQDAVKDLEAVRDPFEAGIFERQRKIEEQALARFQKDPLDARRFLTEYTRSLMEEAVKKYRELRYTLITKYKN